MPTSTTKTTTYSPPLFIEEARQLLDIFRCGHTKNVPYHVQGRYAVTNKVTGDWDKSSFVKDHWQPALWNRPRVQGEPDLPRTVYEPRYLTAEMVAQHLAGKGYLAVSPPSWVGWFALDIDLPKLDDQNFPLPYEDACRQRDVVLEGVWDAFDFGTGREPVVIRTPGGGYHVYVPLTAREGKRHNWNAGTVRNRVIARLRAANMEIRNGHLEVWPVGNVLRLPMGKHMALMHAQNPDDAGCLGLVPVHATESMRPGGRAPGFKRNIQSSVRAFLEAFEARRLTLGDWLQHDEANWSDEYGPFGDDPPSKSEKNQTLTHSHSAVSQQAEDSINASPGFLLRGNAFRSRITELLEKGLTEPGTRHDACLKLTYYFGICLGLSESRALAELETWLGAHNHITNETSERVFKSKSLREARQYYRNNVTRIGVLPGVQTVSLGLPLSTADHNAFEGKFSSPAVEEAALILLRFIKSHSNASGNVQRPVQISTRLAKKLCGEKRVSVGVEGGKRKRVRATQLALDELAEKGVLTLYVQYKVDHYARIFCCWYEFGSGKLPELNSTGELVVATKIVSEGKLVVVAEGKRLGRAKVKLEPSEDVPQIPDWVQRMYANLNIAPLDLAGDVSENLGAFRDFQGSKRRKTAPVDVKCEKRELGTVATFEDDRGYGFIIPDNGGRELFFHQTSICESGRSWRTLKAGERVEFTRTKGDKGPKALWVAPIVASDSKPSPPLPANSNTSAENADELPDWIEYFAESSPLPRSTRWKDWRT